MNKTFRKIGTAIMGLALVAGLSTSCSNGDWEDNLQGGIGGGIGQGGNNGKVSVYFAMQAPIRVITLGNDDDAVNTDDNAHQFKLQATWGCATRRPRIASSAIRLIHLFCQKVVAWRYSLHPTILWRILTP